MTYTIVQVEDMRGRTEGIICHVCKLTSFNPRDISERYCGHCHAFHAELEAKHIFDCPECLHRVQVDEHGACPHNRKS